MTQAVTDRQQWMILMIQISLSGFGSKIGYRVLERNIQLIF